MPPALATQELCSSIQILASLSFFQSLWSAIRAVFLHVLPSYLPMVSSCCHWNLTQRASHRGQGCVDEVHEAIGMALGQLEDPQVRHPQ